MRRYRILLVGIVSLLTTIIIPLSIAEEPNQDEVSTATLIPTTNESNMLRFLRGSVSIDEDRTSRGEGADVLKYDYRVDTVPKTNDSDIRIGGTSTLAKLESLKSIKVLSQTMPKVSKSFAEKLSPVLMKLKLQVWSKNGMSVNFVEKELGLDELFGAAFTKAPTFKYYDEYVISQLPLWTEKGYTPNKVILQLNLQGLPAEIFKASPNFKYYDKFMSAQALMWSEKHLSIDDVLIKLGLNTIPEIARTKTVNYKYYEEFVISRMKTWVANDATVSDVMANLKLDKLTGDAFLSNPNYPYYKYYVKMKLRSWATDGVSPDEVLVKLDLENLRGKTLTIHPNYRFFEKYLLKSAKYREEGWLKQGFTTYDIWQKLEVYRVHPIIRRRSSVFKVYKSYVNVMDDYIIELGDIGFPIPNLISKDASPDELWEKTLIWTSAKRPEWYVKYSLELDGLGENALKEAKNFQLYEYYRDGLNRID